jgi:hypothetical protein
VSGKSYLFSNGEAEIRMAWRDKLLDQLAAAIPCGYDRRGPAATEPTSLAAIALFLEGRTEKSLQAMQWLESLQDDDGSLGPTESLREPGWPTALALLAYAYLGRSAQHDVLGLSDEAALSASADEIRSVFRGAQSVRWLLEAKPSLPKKKPSTGEQHAMIGHDTTLIGWPWVLGTHSWVEPTALAVLALKAAGKSDHPRTREAVRLLRDRLMPNGGCNYGNTIVLGQMLRPHIQPTGLTLLALHGENDADGRVARSLEYLTAAINQHTAAASLAYALWALARHERPLPQTEEWLAAAANRRATLESPLRMALVLLAAEAQRLATQSVLPARVSIHCSP